MRFSSGCEAAVEVHQRLVPAKGSWERRSVKGAPKAGPAAGDVALALVFSAVVIERREPGERRCLLPADKAELGHPDNQGQRGALANTRHAHQEIQSNSQIVVSAQLLGNEAQLRESSYLEPRNVGENHSFKARFADVLEPGLEASDILLDLFDEGQGIGKRSQSQILPNLMRFDYGRTCGNQSRIKGIIFGSLTVQAREGPHLEWLENQNNKARRLQVPDHPTLVTTGRLDPDPL
ncbi:hypothetical protein FBZ94_106637, partial [Bradyrhizobium sacchari]